MSNPEPLTDRPHPPATSSSRPPPWDRLLLDARLATLRDDLGAYGVIEDGALAWKDGLIAFAGPRGELPGAWAGAATEAAADATGACTAAGAEATAADACAAAATAAAGAAARALPAAVNPMRDTALAGVLAVMLLAVA